jgi:predicted hydrocarbon binding protein
MPENKSFINTLEIKFQQAFDSLLKDSAYQFELTRGVIQTLAERDPNEALIVATELNTQERKNKAVQLVLYTALRTQGEADISKLIKDSLDFLDEFDESQRDECLVNIVREFTSRECVLARTWKFSCSI